MKNNQKFKLILGLGNKDIKSALDMALLYARAGVRFFDTAPEILPGLRKTLVKSGFKLDEFVFCVSVPSLGDIHGRKAKISEVVCAGCGLCAKNCLQGAISKDKKTAKYAVDEKKCIGCGVCRKVTNCYAVSFEYGNSEIEFLKTELIDKGSGPDMVELHASIGDKNRIVEDFKLILSFFKGDISVCINRKQFPLEDTAALLKTLERLYIETGGQGQFYVQADGASMNGGAEDKDSTLECILFAKELSSFGFNLIISGGTNLETPDTVKEFGLDTVIAYGSFARKIVLNETRNQALIKARELFTKTCGI